MRTVGLTLASLGIGIAGCWKIAHYIRDPYDPLLRGPEVILLVVSVIAVVGILVLGKKPA